MPARMAKSIMFVVVLTVLSRSAGAQSLTPLYYWYYSPNHLFWTTSTNEPTGSGWSYQGITAYVYDSEVSGTVPLYRWFNASNSHHFYTTSTSSPGGGWDYEGVACYVFSSQEVGTVPLYRWYLSTGKHYYTTSQGNPGGTYEGIEGYVSPPS